MADYPNTLPKPDVNGFEESPAADPTLRAEMESGHTVTRARFTRVPNVWQFKYTQMSDADKAELKAFEVSVKYGAGSFNWVNPIDEETYVVRFAEPVKYVLSDSNAREWNVTVKLQQV